MEIIEIKDGYICNGGFVSKAEDSILLNVIEQYIESGYIIHDYTNEQLIAEAKAYLNNTDYKMTVDYFATLTQVEQDSFISKRAEYREFVRVNSHE